MNKKVLSFLLALVMVLSMIPVGMYTAHEVSATETSLTGNVSDGHGSHSEEDGWIPWDGTTFPSGSPMVNGAKYYLTQSATSGTNFITAAEVTVCLNGHSLTAPTGQRIFRGGGATSKLTICDCQAEFDEKGNLISENNLTPNNQYGGVYISNATQGELIMENVIIDGMLDDGSGYVANGNGGLALGTWNWNLMYKLEDCVIKNCHSSSIGAAVYLQYGGSLKTKRVLFENNYSSQYGGAICAYKTNTLNLENTTFYNNRADLGGGAIVLASTAHTVITNNVTFDQNSVTASSTYGGGAILAKDAASTITLSGGKFYKNQSTLGGGAICFADAASSLNATGVTFEQNKVTGSTAYGGGAILSKGGGSLLQFGKCAFTQNTSTGQGGAISINSGNNGNELTECTFTQNQSSAAGGAIMVGSGKLTVTDTGFNQNQTTGNNGGAIHASKQVDVTRGTFTGNSGGDGGAVYVTYQSNFTDCTFSQNTARRNGGAAFVSCASNAGRVTFNRGSITGNTAATNGGGIYNASTAQEVNIAGNLTVTGNTVGDVEQNVYLVSGAKVRTLSLTKGAQIGVTAAAEDGTNILTGTDTSYAAGMIFSDVASKYIVGDVDGAKELSLAVLAATVDGEKYGSLTAAIEASNGNIVKLANAVADTVELPATATIDMNGKDFADGAKLEGAAGGSTVCIADTTLTYDSAEPTVIPKAAIGTNVTIPGAYKVDNRRYVAIENGENIEIHRVQLTITAKTLRPRNTGIGVKVKFNAANSILTQDYMKGFGMQFKVTDGETVITEQYKLPMGIEITGDSEMTVLITEFLQNADWADYTVTAIPYITLENGETVEVEGTPITVNFKDMVSYAESTWNSGMSQVQKEAIADMYNRHEAVMSGWSIDMTNIKTLAAER